MKAQAEINIINELESGFRKLFNNENCELYGLLMYKLKKEVAQLLRPIKISIRSKPTTTNWNVSKIKKDSVNMRLLIKTKKLILLIIFAFICIILINLNITIEYNNKNRYNNENSANNEELRDYNISYREYNKTYGEYIKEDRESSNDQLKDNLIVDIKTIEKIQKNRINKSACVLPYLNPVSPDILHFIQTPHLNCSVRRYGRITNDGWFILKSNNASVSTITIKYIYRKTDFIVKFSDAILVKLKNGIFKHKLEDDFIQVEHNVEGFHHTEFHAHISSRSQNILRKNALKRADVKGLGLDIVLLMIDSQSNANFHRQLNKSMPQLLNDENTIILNGHTIIGDGTTAQLAGILIGEHEKDLPEARRSFTSSGTCDKFNFIFKDFHKAGFITMLSEDFPQKGAFHYRLNGFINEPTSWYLRPFWLAQTPSPKCDVEYNNILLKTFTETFEDIPKLSLVMNSEIAHGNINNLKLIDNDILEIINYFKMPERINHTILIIFGDHGERISEFRLTTQGKLEERLPFFSITLPVNFKEKYSNLFTALKKNSKVLTNHFDVYATLQHMISYPDFPKKKFIGQSLFTEINPELRTCKSSGVADHWCPCLKYENISVTDTKVKMVAKTIVDFINKVLSKNEKAAILCANLTLNIIISSGLKTLKNEVKNFKKTERNKECDSCGVVYNTSSVAKEYYEVVFTVNPSNGTFEANADVLPDNTIIVDENISRINRYGNHPHCIMNEFPHLRPYCYCT
ncbi:uncharacterized protein LOC136075863 [Hydra vulgaris]|uniref:Uncharacterized protein LOC136075863 n=1 Tax=Hydra vulgaris TaxID=6087 RepID=A0ABM4B930_HYDVU